MHKYLYKNIRQMRNNGYDFVKQAGRGKSEPSQVLGCLFVQCGRALNAEFGFFICIVLVLNKGVYWFYLLQGLLVRVLSGIFMYGFSL